MLERGEQIAKLQQQVQQVSYCLFKPYMCCCVFKSALTFGSSSCRSMPVCLLCQQQQCPRDTCQLRAQVLNLLALLVQKYKFCRRSCGARGALRVQAHRHWRCVGVVVCVRVWVCVCVGMGEVGW